MEFLLQPRDPVRHKVNQHVMRLKLGREPPHMQAAHFDLVRAILSGNLTQQATNRFGEQVGAELADQAAARAIDDIRACKMYWDAWIKEMYLLSSAIKEYKRHRSRLTGGWLPNIEVGPWPRWMQLLWVVLVASRRSWSYCHLWTLRDLQRGWQGRLSEAWGTSDKIVSEAKKHGLQVVYDELSTAYEDLEKRTTPPVDPVERFLETLNHRQASLAEVSVETLSSEILDCLGEWSDFACGDHADLGSALANVRMRLGDSADRSQVVDAVVQLHRETESPGDAHLFGSEIEAVLRKLPAEHQREQPPEHVLAAVDRIPIVNTAATDSDDPSFVRQALAIRLLADAAAAGGPSDAEHPWQSLAVDVFVSLLECRPLTWIRDRVVQMLPEPQNVPGGLLDAVHTTLMWWQGLVNAIPASRRTRRSVDFAWQPADLTWQFLEVPEAVRANPAFLDAAINLVTGWRSGDRAGSATWHSVPDNQRNTFAEATLDLILDHLVSKMIEVYRGPNATKKLRRIVL